MEDDKAIVSCKIRYQTEKRAIGNATNILNIIDAISWWVGRM